MTTEFTPSITSERLTSVPPAPSSTFGFFREYPNERWYKNATASRHYAEIQAATIFHASNTHYQRMQDIMSGKMEGDHAFAERFLAANPQQETYAIEWAHAVAKPFLSLPYVEGRKKLMAIYAKRHQHFIDTLKEQLFRSRNTPDTNRQYLEELLITDGTSDAEIIRLLYAKTRENVDLREETISMIKQNFTARIEEALKMYVEIHAHVQKAEKSAWTSPEHKNRRGNAL